MTREMIKTRKSKREKQAEEARFRHKMDSEMRKINNMAREREALLKRQQTQNERMIEAKREEIAAAARAEIEAKVFVFFRSTANSPPLPSRFSKTTWTSSWSCTRVNPGTELGNDRSIFFVCKIFVDHK